MDRKKRHSICIVDDEPSILAVFAEQLDEWYEVRGFSNGAELLDEIDSLTPSLFVIDWIMPEMNGIQLCRAIREQPRLDLVPVAFFTGVEPTLENVEKALASGAQCFMAKTQAQAFLAVQVHALIDSYERLAHYFHQRRLMLSVLKHEMANLATGVVTGVEVLAMHPAFREENLKRQSVSVITAGRNLRVLLDDLNEVLAADPHDRDAAVQSQPVAAAELFADLADHVGGLQREVVVDGAAHPRIVCHRRSLGRSLYYLVRFIDGHIPTGLPLTVGRDGESGDGEGMRLSVRAPGQHGAVLRRGLDNLRRRPDAPESRRDLLFVRYVETVLAQHGTHLEVVEDANASGLGFALGGH